MQQTLKTWRTARLLVLLFGIIALSGCNDDEDEDDAKQPSVEHALTLSGMSSELDKEGGSFDISIRTADTWKVSTDCKWLFVRPEEGRGDATLTVTYYENTETNPREAHISVTNMFNNQQQSLTVRQKGREAGAANYVSHRAIIGDLQKGEKCYLEITFDKPIKLKEAYFERYLLDWNPEYSADRCTVRHIFKAGAIGLDVRGVFTVESDDGVKTEVDLTFPFYEKAFHPGSGIEGDRILGSLLNDDEQTVWLSCSLPARLVQLSLADGTVKHTVDMPFTPGNISKNPYNGMLYVMPNNEWSVLGYANQLCVINPDNGIIQKTINIETSPKAHPQHPTIYPRELQFTADGMGILLLVAQYADMLEWRYIDSANGDEVTPSGYDWAEYQFEHVYAGYNHQMVWGNPYPRMYQTISWMSRTHAVPVDYELSTNFRDNEYDFAGGNMMTMQFHRSRNKVFISTAPACQCVIDLDKDTYTKTTPAEARGTAAAWDYTDADRNLVYFVGGLDNNFLLLDMDIANALYYQHCKWNDDIIGLYHLATAKRVLVIDYTDLYLVNINK